MYTSVNEGKKPLLNVTFVSPFLPSEMKMYTTSKNKNLTHELIIVSKFHREGNFCAFFTTV